MKRKSQDMVLDAELIALRIHQNQTYDSIFPYERHLRDVVNIAINFGFGSTIIVACWLHDAIEDGDLSYNDIKKFFNKEIAEIVFAVTDELGRNRKERKLKTYPKIRANKNATIVKLCDRIANLEHGIKMESPQSLMYKKEHSQFREELYQVHHGDEVFALWDYLDNLISSIK
jgi:(p)ppGpp synthase/HD superfamily hydrolase